MAAAIHAGTSTPPPRLALPANRDAVLAAVLDPGRLPTPPAVALQIVNAASNPDCDPDEIVALLGQDPALCAKLLRAVNSCLYGLSRPVGSLRRAVTILGLHTVRSLVLGLSLPAMRAVSGPDEALREFWVASVGGAIMARELAVRTRRLAPEDDLIAGLLQDLGAVLLQQTFPAEWRGLEAVRSEYPLDDPGETERQVFCVSHADVGAELLRLWHLPEDIVEPIRYHHQPARLAGADPRLAERAELLCFVGFLNQLDVVTQQPESLEHVLALARDRFDLSRTGLVHFLQGVAPKVEAFAKLLLQDVGQQVDLAAILSAGTEELVKITVEASRTRLSGSTDAASTIRTRIAPVGPAAAQEGETRVDGPGLLPEFCPEFLEHFPKNGCRLGDYQLRQFLGQGATGWVFKAYEPSLDRHVAVKVLAPVLAACPAYRRRFVREARLAAAVRHENVVGIYAVRETGGTSYLAMEYVEGGSLQEHLEAQGPPPVPVLIQLARQIASGLAAAHARGIVHRDIKPANILLAGKSETRNPKSETEERPGLVSDLNVKVTDFGLARSDTAGVSQEGGLVGTPLFMSPEHVTGGAIGPHSDLFSLGGVLYAMSTGQLPFPGEMTAAVLHAVCQAEPVPPRQLRPELPAWFEEAVMRLLRKKPADRFATADEVVALLAAHGG